MLCTSVITHVVEKVNQLQSAARHKLCDSFASINTAANVLQVQLLKGSTGCENFATCPDTLFTQSIVADVDMEQLAAFCECSRNDLQHLENLFLRPASNDITHICSLKSICNVSD